MEKGSKERKQLEKVLKRIGEEGQGGTKIAFGDAGSTRGIPNLARTNGLSITINFQAIDDTARGFQLNSNEAKALDAGVTGHEGEHIRKVPLFGIGLPLQGERGALFVESVVYQGLRKTDRVSKLWNESWASVDRHIRESRREQAINQELQRQKEQQKRKED